VKIRKIVLAKTEANIILWSIAAGLIVFVLLLLLPVRFISQPFQSIVMLSIQAVTLYIWLSIVEWKKENSKRKEKWKRKILGVAGKEEMSE